MGKTREKQLNGQSLTMEQLKIFVANSPSAMAMFDRDMKYLSCSDRWITEYRLEDKKVIGECHYDVFPNIPDRWKEDHKRALLGENLKSDEDTFIEGGEKYWLRWDVRPWYQVDGEVGGIMMLCEIFTEQKKRELEIDLALKNAEVGIWRYDLINNVIEWDHSMYELWAINDDSFKVDLETWSNQIDQADRERVFRSFDIALESSDKFDETYLATKFDGTKVYIGVHANIERNAEGKAIYLYGINIDRTKETLDKQRIEETNQYLDLALDATNLGSWDWWLEDNRVRFDERWASILGLPFDEIQMDFDQWERLVHPDDLAKSYERIQDYLEGRTERYENVHRMKHQDGHWVYILGQGKVSQYNEEGKPIRFTGTNLDLRKQKLQEEDLRVAKEKAEIAERTKSEFLANMSHEIRSPMNGVLGMVELLSDSPLNEEQQGMLETIRSCGESLLVIINDILDISKIETNKLEIESNLFGLNSCVEDIAGLFRHLATSKGLEFNVFNKTPNEQFLFGDKNRIRQVLTNIISNAIKFTDEGSISLYVKTIPLEDQRVKVKFKIEDTGIGISEASKNSLFKPFSQADSSITRKYGGTGLGLTISKELVELMNGQISYDTEEGKGTTFFIDIILEELEAPEQEPQKEACPDHEFALEYPHEILLVEDNLINQKVAVSFLKKLGYECDVANDGAEAFEMAKKKRYSFIFMDMQMPVMDGVSSSQKILEQCHDNCPIIVALTANAFESDKRRCFEAGMQGFISKPLRKEDIKKVISDLSKKL